RADQCPICPIRPRDRLCYGGGTGNRLGREEKTSAPAHSQTPRLHFAAGLPGVEKSKSHCPQLIRVFPMVGVEERGGLDTAQWPGQRSGRQRGPPRGPYCL